MQTTIRYFASVREAIGHGSETLELPQDLRTLGDVRHWLAQRSPRHAMALAPDKPLRVARDHVMAEPETPLRPGCEVAFFPPVTGG
ncbi:MAG: molybdopterin converting factor subunit 1 [Thiomonas sp. 15-66-11]|jgi:molybdopterin synthase sulfur carrier subunit|uniref:Molybdopterin synthase sulfur carrier subunit n=1 Tax=Thiomonas delicata TaxID=364030 RepID=A0A238D8Z5_THIDL|nr:molybdopterin converting factor subunit 1 [Thiomonas delicata]OZB46130.1 MAG: molybdopterin converting factor subunit 1 [Thiomonas sp. 15-66-11]SBP89604.1 molybdopterin synthase, small subunit [Thiomonas delicata]